MTRFVFRHYVGTVDELVEAVCAGLEEPDDDREDE